MTRSIIFCLWAGLLFIAVPVIGQGFDPAYRFIRSESPFRDNAFYFLTLLEKLPAVNKAIQQDDVLKGMLKNQMEKIQELPTDCGDSMDCYVGRLCWQERDNRAICRALSGLLTANAAFQKMMKEHIRACGNFRRYDSLTDTACIQQLWEDAADAMNHCFKAYMKNEGLLYSAIDSAHYPVMGRYYKDLIHEMIMIIKRRVCGMHFFFDPSFAVTEELLSINNRDEAIRYDLAGINAVAYAKTPLIKWHDYTYSAIFVPGEGPEDINVPLSAHGKYRCELAAILYKAGKAPFIIVSGGHVHPFQTPYSEAIEMKKYLMKKWDIPASAILADPFARHTTTNFRNAGRFIFRQRMPDGMKVLGISGIAPVNYIVSARFLARCKKELGYCPFLELQRVDEFSFEFYPVALSLQVDARDPLDP